MEEGEVAAVERDPRVEAGLAVIDGVQSGDRDP